MLQKSVAKLTAREASRSTVAEAQGCFPALRSRPNESFDALSANRTPSKQQASNQQQEYDEEVKLTIDLDREEDGRWIADALELPGVMCYGRTRDEAISNTERLAIEVIADRISHQELPSSALDVSFTISGEQLARQ